jgi:hypothetical protein
VIVVRADETIPFYNPAVASVLGLPFPPDRVTLADLRERNLVALRADGSPYPLEEQPSPAPSPTGTRSPTSSTCAGRTGTSILTACHRDRSSTQTET